MNRCFVRIGGAILALLAAASSARAQVAEPQRLGIAEALAMAEERSPDYAAARARAEAQDLRRRAAERAWWPRLSLGTEVSSTNVPARVFAQKLNRGAFGAEDLGLGRLNDPDAIGHLASMAALEMSVDLAGGTRARAGSAQAAARAATAQVQEAQQELRFRVTDAYSRAALAEAAVAAIERALAGARAREASLEARVAEGAALPADLLRARTRRRQREADLARARGDEQAARAGFAEALGAAGTVLAPLGPLPPGGQQEGTLDSWLAGARERRALPRAAAERRAATEWAHKGESAARWPTLAAYASVLDDRWSGASSGSYAVGAALRWTWDPAQGRRVAAAEADLSAAAWEVRAAGARVDTEVRTAWARLAAAREALAAARGGTEEGREALRVVRERRASGLATLTDELETEAAGLAAEVDELRAQADLALAEAALQRAAGSL